MEFGEGQVTFGVEAERDEPGVTETAAIGRRRTTRGRRKWRWEEAIFAMWGLACLGLRRNMVKGKRREKTFGR